MMKAEFEQRIGKQVDWDVWETYEAMYMAVDVDKDTFVRMLNVDAIPESTAAIEARERNAKVIEGIKQELEDIRAQIADAQSWIDYYKFCMEGEWREDYKKQYWAQARGYRSRIQMLQQKRKALKTLFAI